MENLIKTYEESFKANRDLPAMTDYLTGKTYTYKELAAKIDKNHEFLREAGIVKGDKIALVGKNSIDWISIYISVVTYGAIIVPILPDFNPIDMVNIINHSDSRILFADKSILDKISSLKMEAIEKVICIEDIQNPDFGKFEIDSVKYAEVDPEDVMIISYTSGTTGVSKGVMLPERSLRHNAEFAISKDFHFKGSRVLGLLPLAHAYGCAFDMITPLAVGSHIYVLGRIPSPKVLLEALGKVKPHLICTVPLVMEKIVQKNVFPKLQKSPANIALKLPVVKDVVYKKVRASLMEAFGGCIKEVNMGGAALAPEVEKFLRRIKFPFTVGYGMTECGPLISYATWDTFKSCSCGKVLDKMEACIMGEGYDEGVGEVCVRGMNVMTGYYKNPEATAAVMIDGWFHTGDIGFIDKDDFIFLRGRCKSMILTSAGQNIYPEEIESKLNNLDYVAESLVYEKEGKLYALVVPDTDKAKKDGISMEALKERMNENFRILNTLVAPYEKVSEIKLCSEPFEKTPKQSIKRFLYPKNAKLF